jgi:hypothetical protein
VVKEMGGLKQVTTCSLAHVDLRPRENWPVFMVDGVWGLTPPPKRGTSKPDLDSEWFSITHLPTGYRAADVRVDNPQKAKVLSKFPAMLGKCKTVTEVGRKWNGLSKQRQRWVKRQVSWLLFRNKGCSHD